MKRIIACLALSLCVCFVATGCQEAEKSTEIVFTTEFEEDEVFRIDTSSCRLPEVNVYMKTTQDQYESVFGNEIWGKDIGGGNTLGDQLKDSILARLAQIKVMNLLAASYELTLTEHEQEMVQEAAKKYISGLSKGEIDALGVTEELITGMYSEYALADKVYEEITKDINPEISDDEARTITVKHILIKTYALDSNGEKSEYTGTQKLDARKRAVSVLKQLGEGADFDAMAEKYNEDDQVNYSFGKGTMPESFEAAAFNLDNDQISDLVETEYGYHIIKCISTFDKAETDANKQKIVRQRKNEAFSEVYGEFVKTLYSNINQELWDSITFTLSPDVHTTNFFDVYNEVFDK